MVMRILVTLSLIVLAGGFIFFAGNVIWLGTKEFFKIYGPKAKLPEGKQLLKEDNTNNTNNINKK